MRIAVGETANCNQYEVWLDGKPIRYAVEASEEDGYVVILATEGPNNKVVWVQGKLKYEHLHGKVEIRKRRPREELR